MSERAVDSSDSREGPAGSSSEHDNLQIMNGENFSARRVLCYLRRTVLFKLEYIVSLW